MIRSRTASTSLGLIVLGALALLLTAIAIVGIERRDLRA